MKGPIELPPELQRLADLLSEQPPEVRDLFRYALVPAMIDDEKARVIGTRIEDRQEWLTIETVPGDVFEIMQPPISEEVEAELREEVRAIIADEDADGLGASPTVARRPWLLRLSGIQRPIFPPPVHLRGSYRLCTHLGSLTKTSTDRAIFSKLLA